MQKRKSQTNIHSSKTGFMYGLIVTLGAVLTAAFFYRRQKFKAPPRHARKKTAIYQGPRQVKNFSHAPDIEIRYQTDVDQEAVSLAENVVKIIKMVLSPIENQIQNEQAKLIVVFCGDFWEMRMKNSSDELKDSVRNLLEAEAW